jgi:hypothetical protein
MQQVDLAVWDGVLQHMYAGNLHLLERVLY